MEKILLLRAYAVIVLLQEVTAIVSHTARSFVYIQYPQNCNTLSMIWFSQCNWNVILNLQNNWLNM